MSYETAGEHRKTRHTLAILGSKPNWSHRPRFSIETVLPFMEISIIKKRDCIETAPKLSKQYTTVSMLRFFPMDFQFEAARNVMPLLRSAWLCSVGLLRWFYCSCTLFRHSPHTSVNHTITSSPGKRHCRVWVNRAIPGPILLIWINFIHG